MADERDELTDAFKAVLATDAGKRVLFWVLEQAAIYQDPFAIENATTNYLLGSQKIGRKLIQQIEAIDAKAYPRLLLDVADMREMKRAAAQNQPKEDDDVEA